MAGFREAYFAVLPGADGSALTLAGGGTLIGTMPIAQQNPLPIVYRKARAWFAVFPFPLRGVVGMLPDPRLRPALVIPGTAALVVAVFDFEDTSIGPYGEVGVGIPCRYRRSTAVPLVPLLAEKWLDDVGPWVHLMPVTTEAAKDAGIQHWGYPKFVAEIDIDVTESRMWATVSEKGAPILHVEVERPGPSRPMAFPVRPYSRLDDELLLTEFQVDAVGSIGRVGAKASLRLESHPRAAALDGFGLERARPIEVRWCDEYRTALDQPRARYRIGG